MTINRTMPVVALSVLCMPFVAYGQNVPASQSLLPTDSAKFSYALGLEIGTSLKQLGEQIDLDALTRAVGHTLRNETSLLDPQQATEIKQKVFEKIQMRQMQQSKSQSQKNLSEGQAFLTANKEKTGVNTTDSGLQYLVLREGAGEKPTATDKVKVHYRGTLLDGTEFDSSYERGQPISFPLNGVIPGWTEGLQLMKTGSHYRLFIPPDLAYGQRGAPPTIGPNATLVFEVELLEIEK